MKYRPFGGTGMRVASISLGTAGQWGGRVDKATAKEIIAVAIDGGCNYIDTADIYGSGSGGRPMSEEFVGEALEGRRHEVLLGTKGCQATGPGPNDWGASRYHLMNALEASLRRLRTDHVDLYQVHLFDAHTPTEETMRTLDDMVRSGKVRYVGASQYQAWQICRANDLAERHGWAPYVTTQAAYNMLDREAERELLPFCRERNVGLLPFSALAIGLLAGRYRPGEAPPGDSRAMASDRNWRYIRQFATPEGYTVIERLTDFARERDHTLPQLAIAWLLAEPAVATVLTGASTVEQARANFSGTEWELSSDELAQVRLILEGDPQG